MHSPSTRRLYEAHARAERAKEIDCPDHDVLRERLWAATRALRVIAESNPSSRARTAARIARKTLEILEPSDESQVPPAAAPVDGPGVHDGETAVAAGDGSGGGAPEDERAVLTHTFGDGVQIALRRPRAQVLEAPSPPRDEPIVPRRTFPFPAARREK